MNKLHMDNRKLNENTFLDLLEKECKKRNWIFENRFGCVVIQTKLESWKFQHTYGKIRLLHKNTIVSPGRSKYHEQWRRFTSVYNLVDFFDRHEKSTYIIH